MTQKKCDFGYWLTFFKRKSHNRASINWSQQDQLPAHEKNFLEKSISQFQLGEYSEGRNLLRFAKAYGVKIDDSRISEVTKFFIQEEQHHAFLLGKFMDKYGMTKKKNHWADTIFRRLRSIAGFELSLTVLTSAEIASLPFYETLEKITSSQILKDICKQLHIDELSHLEYESELLHDIRSTKPLIQTLRYTFHIGVLIATSCCVWFNHKKILQRGNFTLFSFLRSTVDTFTHKILTMKKLDQQPVSDL